MKHFLQSTIFAFCTLAVLTVMAQDRSLTGKITDQAGSPVPGVNVVLKGTSNGTITDIDGAYVLNVPDSGGTIVFSYIGLRTREVEVEGRSVLDVTMEADIHQLSEVVVTAIGIERAQKALGYSVEHIEREQIQRKSEPDILKAMQGKIPGVQIASSSGVPGSATRITIRGNSSFLDNNTPLVVVDGIPYNAEQYGTYSQLTGGGSYANALSTLDPNIIESISVLKGAAAAALYGSRAANGVILVTTKTGKSRFSRKGLEVTLSSSYSIEQIGNLPEYQNRYGNGTEFQYQNSNGSWGPAFAQRDSFPTWPNYLDAFPGLPANLPYAPRPDNVKNLFETGSLQENSITVSNGNEKASLTMVVSDMDHKGYIPHSSFNRTTFTLGGFTQLENNFNAGGNFSYTTSVQEGPLFGDAGAQDPGAASSFARTLWMGRNWDTSLPYTNPQTGGPVFFNTLTVDHPLWSWENNGITSEVDRYTANVSLGYDLNDNLFFDYKIGFNSMSDRRLQVWDIGSTAFSGSGAIIEDDIYYQEIESNLLATYTTIFYETISLKAIAGWNVNQQFFDRSAVQGTGLVAAGIFQLTNTSATSPLNLSSTLGGSGISRKRLWGVFADLSFGYKDWLFLNLTGRNDVSSTLPEDNNSYFYPSVSSSFIFTEAFDLTNNILSLGKIRLSYARVGNDADPYSLSNLFQINLGNNTNIIGSLTDNDLPFKGQNGATQANTAFDPDLSPEFTTELEAGILLNLLQNRIVIDFTYYDRESVDQIAAVSLPTASGFEQIVTNFGKLSNSGVELGLGITPVRLQNGLEWEVYTAFTKNTSLVEELADGIERINIQNLFGGSVTPVLEPGEPYGILRGSISARDEEGNLLVDPQTGVLFPDVVNGGQGKIGDPNPDFILGITNTIRFKNITVFALLDYRHGGDLYSTTVEKLLGRGVTRDTEIREASIIIPNAFLGDPNTGLPLRDDGDNKIPNTVQITANDAYFANGAPVESFGINAADEWSVYDGTVIRLREVTLGYELPRSLLEATPLGTVSISFSGRNLWYNAPNIPEHTNFDPEVNGFGSTNTQGIEYASAPSTKRYGVNIQVTF